MKKQYRGETATKHLKQWSLALAAGASLFAGAARADTTITGSPATITGNVLTTFWDGAGTVTFAAGASLTQAGDQVAPPTGYVITNPLIFEGDASLRFNGNDTKYNFSGPISGTAAGNLIIKTEQAVSGNGDRPDIAFSSPVPDGSGGTIGFNLYFNTQSDSQSYVNFTAVNTFTGPITLNTPNNNSIGYLTIGGERYKKAFDATNYTIPGSGSIGPAANYPGNITTATRTVLGFNTSANQEISGVISGAGSVRKEVAGSTLTLSGLNTYTGTTTVDAGTVALTSTGGLTFLVNDASSNKITGAGTATLDGQFTIDTSAVTVGFNSWKLVDTTTSSYGSNFSVAAPYTENVPGIWTYENGAQIFQFVEATGTLYVSDFASIIYFGIAGSTAVIDQNALTINLTVPYTPWGTSLAPLAPSFGASTGTVTANTNAVTSGGAPTPTFAVTNPATYKVTDLVNSVEKEYTVQVNVTPAATGKAMSNVRFPGYGAPWEQTPFNYLIVVPASTNVTALAPTFTLSPFATVSVASGTPRNFTTTQSYTVTAQDGSSQVYTMTVQKITNTGVGAYQQKVLASGPVSYWPLNETSGTTAFDLASGLNNMTYGGTLTLNQTGLRPDGNPCVLFTSASADPNNTKATYTNSLNPDIFTIECWVKPTNLNGQYLVSLQDRSAGVPGGGRWGYAIMKNNGGSGFSVMGGQPGTAFNTAQGSTTVVAGRLYHVVAVSDGTTLSLYVNGVLDATTGITNYAKATATQPGFTVGSRNGITGASSRIQDVALYTRALSQSEVQDHTGLIVTYSGNGSNGGTVPAAGIGYSSGNTVTVESDTMTRTNYTFVNWNTQANGSGSSYNPAATFSITANTTLYAQWKLTDYVAWEAIYAPNNLSNPASNFDGDSLSNFQEYAFGLDPTSGASVNPISVPLDSGLGSFSYTRRATAPLTYTIWFSTNLQTWTQDAGATQLSAGVIGDVETMDVTLSGAAVPVGGKLFVQVRAQ
jgi:uncharacterized repeat protein (TIGR02543 family)